MANLKSIDKITLKDMMDNVQKYRHLPDGLIQLPVPDDIKIGRRLYAVPQNLSEFTDKICYGQKLFLSRKEENDFGLMLRIMDGYYYPIVTKQKWDEDKALLFGKIVLNCTVNHLYPVAMHLVNLLGELADREKELLHREPSKVELAAGIQKLNVFAELTSLDFLRDAMKVTVPEVLLTPYNECLVRFMIAKETTEYQNRYMELMMDSHKTKADG